jgi:arylsulfatase
VSDRPNILLITTDQQRFDTLQAAGNSHILTPHLNWLADSGIRYSNAYSDCPICMPARATIMTGRHGYSMGLTGNTGAVRPIDARYSLPGLLTGAGYQTRAQGKMHFMPNRCHYGFEQMEILDDYYRHMARHPEKGVPMDHGLGQNEMAPGISTVDESNSLTHWAIDRSVDFLETRDNTRPFFLWTSFAKPHPPLDPCRSYWELYRDATVPDPVTGNWSDTLEDIAPGWREPSLKLNMAWRYSAEQIRMIRRAYYACITQIDYNLGLLFARMREMDLLKNTLILFTSDHGEMLGDHRLGAKTSGLEGSAHIPMLVRPPQADWNFSDPRRGMVCDKLVCLADVLPTCLAFAGMDVPAEARVDGIDLLGAAASGAGRDCLFGECEAFHFVRQGAYKYLYENHGGSELLFDIAHDPYEQHELIRAGGHDAVLAGLRAKLLGRLQAAKHPAVRDGRLVRRSASAAVSTANAWPGFHSRQLPDEVAH